jgi:hypothetical protein
MSRDRAEAVASAVLQIIKQHLNDDALLRGQLVEALRDEFTDVARMTRDEIRDSE